MRAAEAAPKASHVRGIDKDIGFDEADDVVDDAIDHDRRTTEGLVPRATA